MRSLEKPRPVRQYLVYVVEISQFLRYAVEALQPTLVSALQQEFLLLEGY